MTVDRAVRMMVKALAEIAFYLIIKSIFMTGYKKLEAWKKSMLLVKEVYLLTKIFPKEELYALTSQTKRAVVSVPCNIAEGSGRKRY